MSRRPWNRNLHYHDLVLRAVPRGSGRVLDVGCGEGRLAAELAEQCAEAVGIDVHAPTLARARAASVRANVSFVEGDVMTHAFAPDSFDFIATIATLHHLPLEAALARFKELLRPGGVLVVIGLYRLQTLSDYAWAVPAILVSWWLRLVNGTASVRAPIREPELTLREIRIAAEKILPGAEFARQLLFRYSLTWRKPSG